MTKKGDKIRAKKGSNIGKIGVIKTHWINGQFETLSTGKDIPMENAKMCWLIEFEDGTVDKLTEDAFEIIS